MSDTMSWAADQRDKARRAGCLKQMQKAVKGLDGHEAESIVDSHNELSVILDSVPLTRSQRNRVDDLLASLKQAFVPKPDAS